MTPADLERRVEEYYRALNSLDAEEWISKFAPEGLVEDPIGAPEVRGHEALRGLFQQLQKSFATLDLQQDFVSANPPRAAVKWTVRASTHQGLEAHFQGISVFDFDSEGRILEMRVFWDQPGLQQQLRSAVRG